MKPRAITPHAVDRFIERHAPNLTFDAAADTLRSLITIAEHVETIADEHQETWRIAWPTSHLDFLIVVRQADGVVTTVLPTGVQRPR